jgi:hypothetical protein
MMPKKPPQKVKKNMSQKGTEAVRLARVRQLFEAREDRTENGVLKFYGWLHENHSELLPTPKQGDAFQHLKVDLKGLYE